MKAPVSCSPGRRALGRSPGRQYQLAAGPAGGGGATFKSGLVFQVSSLT